MHRSVLALVLLLGTSACGGDDGSGAGGPVPAGARPAGPSDGPSEPGANDGCPAEFPLASTPWVPSPPTTQTDGRLVPDADPVTAVVCRYRDVSRAPSEDGPAPLVGEVALVGGLDRVRLELLLPRRLPGQGSDCTQVGGPLVPHLVRFDYADGSLWLSSLQDVGSCQDSGNGAFVTSAYLGGVLADSYDAGAWSSSQPGPGCPVGGGGRAGQELALVPPGWSTLAVCEAGPGPAAAPAPGTRTTAEQVTALLGQVSTAPGSGGCAGPDATTYVLVLGYPQGPPVEIRVSPGCRPEVRGGSLVGTPTADQLAALVRLLRTG